MRRLPASSLALLLAACAPLPPERPDARGGDAVQLPADGAAPRGDDGPRRLIDGGPMQPFDASNVPDAVPENAPRSKYGNPSSYEVFGRRYHVMRDARGYQERGVASWYGTKFHGARTSSGERYDMYSMTAAHKTLPLPTWVRVTNLENHRSVVVKVNDRGPFHQNRIIDLSYSAALKLGIVGKGTGLVEVRALGPGASLESSGVPQDQTVATPLPTPRTADTGTPAVTAGLVDAPRSTALGTVPDAAPAPMPQPAAPSAVTAAPHAPQLFLQVGAFAEEKNARALALRLQENGIGISAVVHGNGDAGNLHKVRIGPLATVEDVDAMTAKLVALGLKDPQLVIP
jgi:rare lipoprotein A